MLRAVLDANVYLSAAIHPSGPPGRILTRFLEEGAFELVLSREIAEEILRAFRYPKFRKYVNRNFDPELWFEDIQVLAQIVAGEYETIGASPDPKDDKYLAAALEGSCDFLVAGDSDLLGLKEYHGIRIVSPRAFLDILSQ